MFNLDTIYNEDCFETFKRIPSQAIDLIFADPWYYPDNSKTKNAFEDEIFWNITKSWLLECVRIIKPDGHLFISFSTQKMAKFEFLLGELQLPLRSRIVWHYRNAGGRCADKGQFGKTYEMIYHIGFGDVLNFPEKWGDERFDVWTIAIPQSNFNDQKIHPFQKPIVLLERIVSIGSKEGEVVFDPFMGSGTTAEACKRLGRHYVGSEKNVSHFDNALQRLAKPNTASTRQGRAVAQNELFG
jgi:DNA modification methylase